MNATETKIIPADDIEHSPGHVDECLVFEAMPRITYVRPRADGSAIEFGLAGGGETRYAVEFNVPEYDYWPTFTRGIALFPAGGADPLAEFLDGRIHADEDGLDRLFSLVYVLRDAAGVEAWDEWDEDRANIDAYYERAGRPLVITESVGAIAWARGAS